MLQNSFSKFGDRPLLVFAGEEKRTCTQLEKEINLVIDQLIAEWIIKGDKVAILSTNMPNRGIAYFAITTIGAISFKIN